LLIVTGTLEPNQFLSALGNRIRTNNITSGAPSSSSPSVSGKIIPEHSELTPVEQSKALVTIGALVKKVKLPIYNNSKDEQEEQELFFLIFW
jgi:hypothetical protein